MQNTITVIIMYTLMGSAIIYTIYSIICDYIYAIKRDFGLTKKEIKIDYSKYRRMKEEEIKQMQIKK